MILVHLLCSLSLLFCQHYVFLTSWCTHHANTTLLALSLMFPMIIQVSSTFVRRQIQVSQFCFFFSIHFPFMERLLQTYSLLPSDITLFSKLRSGTSPQNWDRLGFAHHSLTDTLSQWNGEVCLTVRRIWSTKGADSGGICGRSFVTQNGTLRVFGVWMISGVFIMKIAYFSQSPI